MIDSEVQALLAERLPESGSTEPLAEDQWRELYAALALVWVAGGEVDWRRLEPTGRRVPLPTYPFQRKSYWLSAGQRKRSKAARLKSAFAVAPRSVAAPAPEATPQSEIAGWFYEPRWQESPRGPQRELPPGRLARAGHAESAG